MKEILLILIIVLAFILYTQAKKMSITRHLMSSNTQHNLTTHINDQPITTEIFEPDNNADSLDNTLISTTPVNIESSARLPADLQSGNINETPSADKLNKPNKPNKLNKPNKRTKNNKRHQVKFNPLVTRRFIDQDAPIDTTASDGLIEEITEPVKKS